MIKRMPRWPLFLIGAPAAVAVWSGWVGLGQLAGFGVIHPLPGIWDSATINTAITLPIGVEAYGAYALGAWLTPGTSERARKFARRSAIGALALGMLGQVAYHLLAAAHATRAPWPVVMFVSCLPVVALALGTALAHLLREPAEADPATATIPVPGDTAGTVAETVPPLVTPAEPASTPEAVPAAVLDVVPEDVPGTGPADVPASTELPAPPEAPRTVAERAPRRALARPKSPARMFSAEIDSGTLPSLREVKRRAACGTPRAKAILAELEALAARAEAVAA